MTAATKLKDACSLKEKYDKPRQCTEKQRHHFSDKGPYSQSYVFSSSHVQVWELDHKEGWVPKNWCFWIVVPEKTLRIPWTARRTNQSILKEINTEYSSEGLYFGHLMQRTDSLEKPLRLGKIKSGERSNRGWDGCTASLNHWTWIWANSGR